MLSRAISARPDFAMCDDGMTPVRPQAERGLRSEVNGCGLRLFLAV